MLGTFSNWQRLVKRTLAGEGIDLDAELRRRGITVAHNELGRLPTDQARAIWRIVDETTADPVFGLSMLRDVTFGDFDELGVALVAVGSVPEMIDRVTTYHQLLTGTIGVRRDPEHETGLQLIADERVSWRVHEFAAALIVRVVRARFGRDVSPRRVALGFRNDAGLAIYARYFRAPVTLGAAQTSLSFEPARVTAAASVSQLRVSRRLEGLLAEELDALQRELPLTAHVQTQVTDLLRGGVPTLDQVAQACNMSTRTLQRRLAEEGRSFRDIVEDARRDLARRWVADGRLSLTEIAYLLGFSSSSAFTRAYRRWYGVPPSQARS